MVNMKLVPNPADALAATIGDKLGKGMGIGKNVLMLLVLYVRNHWTCIYKTYHRTWNWNCTGSYFTGRVIAVYNYFLKHPMQNLAGITAEL